MKREQLPSYERRERTYAMEFCPACETSHLARPDGAGGRETDCPNR